MTIQQVKGIPQLGWKYNPGLKTDYGIGVVGTGFVASTRHIPSYLNAGFKVVAIADTNKDLLERTQSQWGITNAFRDYRKLIELKEVEIVDILTPRWVRPQVVKAAAAAGKHIMCQKPFAETYEDALSMVQDADLAGVKLGVHLEYHWMPCYRGAWSLIQQGIIGSPYFILFNAHFNHDAEYHRDPRRRWNLENIDDYLHVEWGAHIFDLLRFWTGEIPTQVQSFPTRSPGQHSISDMVCIYEVKFRGLTRATVVLSQCSQSQVDEEVMRFRIEGSEGVIRGDKWFHLECDSNQLGLVGLKWDLETNIWLDNFKATMGDFMDAITEDREPTSSGRENLDAVCGYRAALRSAREGRFVNLDEIRQSGGS